jgi:hypothetical protein
VAIATLAAVGLLRLFGSGLHASARPDPAHDVMAQARLRDLRLAVELFGRERGEFPRRLDDLVDDRWLEPAELRLPGYTLDYAVVDGGQDFRLVLAAAR